MKLTKELYKGFKTYPEKVIQFGGRKFFLGFVELADIDKMNEEANFNGSVAVVQPSRGWIN